MTDDRIDKAEQKLAEAHRALARVQGSTGVVVTESKLELVIDAVSLLAAELRGIRGETAKDEDVVMGSGIQVFDSTPPA